MGEREKNYITAYISVLGQKKRMVHQKNFYFLKTSDAGVQREEQVKAGNTGGSLIMQYL